LDLKHWISRQPRYLGEIGPEHILVPLRAGSGEEEVGWQVGEEQNLYDLSLGALS